MNELQFKLEQKMYQGEQITPDFELCCDFFNMKAETVDELGDTEAQEIDDFISKYDDSA